MDIATYKRMVENSFGDSGNVFLTEQEIIDSLNEGRRVVLRETHHNVATASAAANTFPITILDLYLLDRATYDNKLLDFISDDLIDDWYSTPQTGVPMYYYLKGNKVYLWPTPESTDTKTVRVDYAFDPTPYTTLTSTATAIDVPVPFHDDLVTLAKAKAHEKNENYRAYELLMAEFRTNLGQRKYELEHGKDSPNFIRPDPFDYIDYNDSLL